MKKILAYFIMLLFVINNYYSQQINVLKSTITSVGSTSASINKYYVSQSIGQTGIVGRINTNTTSIQQGFLNNIISYKINNSINNTIHEVLDFFIYPNPFVEYIKIDFSKVTNEDIYIKIYDVIGKIYSYKKYLPTNKIIIPMNRLSIGNYLIQIKSGRNTVTKKVFKVE